MITYILIYFAIAFLIPLWDAFIGFGFEFTTINKGPTATIVGLFWPIGLPIILLIIISNILNNAKNARLKRQAAKKQSLKEKKLELQKKIILSY